MLKTPLVVIFALVGCARGTLSSALLSEGGTADSVPPGDGMRAETTPGPGQTGNGEPNDAGPERTVDVAFVAEVAGDLEVGPEGPRDAPRQDRQVDLPPQPDRASDPQPDRASDPRIVDLQPDRSPPDAPPDAPRDPGATEMRPSTCPSGGCLLGLPTNCCQAGKMRRCTCEGLILSSWKCVDMGRGC